MKGIRVARRAAQLTRKIDRLKAEIDVAITARDEASAAAAHDDLIEAENEVALIHSARRYAR